MHTLAATMGDCINWVLFTFNHTAVVGSHSSYSTTQMTVTPVGLVLVILDRINTNT